MAEALASFLVEQLAIVFKHREMEQTERLVNDTLQDEVNKLEDTFKNIQEVLRDAEKRQFNDENVKRWLDEFKDVAYDMEDVLDEWRTEVLRTRITTEVLRSHIEGTPTDDNDGNFMNTNRKVSSYFSTAYFVSPKLLYMQYDIGSRIKEIRERLDLIHKEKDQFEFIITSTITSSSKGYDIPKPSNTRSILDVLDICDRDSDKTILTQQQEEIFKPLLLSYLDLQSPVKRCFAYCSIFPKDHRLKKHTLIKMWMAQGFLDSTSSENMDPESIGEKYFSDLAERSFFIDLSKDENDDLSKISCKMHDIVHDFAQIVTKNEIYTKHKNDKPLLDDCSKARHLSLIITVEDHVEPSSFNTSVFNADKNLRTLLISSKIRDSSFRHSLSGLVNHLRCLRVLKLKRMNIAELPSVIKELIHLRYLDLSYNRTLNELPDSVCSLYNLQTLKLKMCQGLRKLPRGMGKMINLRHLDIRETNNLSLPEGIGKLTSLRTLNEFIACDGASGGCKIRELKDLNLLQGSIRIRGLGRLKTANEASEAELNKKQGLCHMVLEFRTIDDGAASKSERVEENLEITECVLGALEPHTNLKVLKIHNYLGCRFPSWIASLTHLRILDLYFCISCTELPALGLLPSLEDLIMRGLDNVKRIGVEIYGHGGDQCVRKVAFPKLKELRIHASKLEVWELDDVEGEIMPCVTSIKLDSKKLRVFPALWKLPCLETLSITGSKELTHIGPEFRNYGGDQCVRKVAFPKLKELRIDASKLEVWELGDVEGEIMPCVTSIQLDSKKLKVLPALWKLPCLETLDITGSKEVTHIGPEFYGISSGTGGGGGDGIFNLKAFPNLKSLTLNEMEELKEFDLGVVEVGNRGEIIIMPRLNKMIIAECPKLKTLRGLSNLQSLEILDLGVLDDLEAVEVVPEGQGKDSIINMPHLLILAVRSCPVLKSLQQLYLPKLTTLIISDCPSLIHLPTSPNITSMDVLSSPKPVLQGIAGFKKLRQLYFADCASLTSIPEYVRHLTSLQTLEINECAWPRDPDCIDQEGEDWSIMSHIPKIIINGRTYE